MSSPIRVFTFINRITKTHSSELVNLTKVSRIEIKNKKISYTMAYETDSFFGNFSGHAT